MLLISVWIDVAIDSFFLVTIFIYACLTLFNVYSMLIPVSYGLGLADYPFYPFPSRIKKKVPLYIYRNSGKN